MAKRVPIKAGDVVLILLSKTEAVLGKILYIYVKQFKGTLIVGVATDRIVDPRKRHPPRVSAWKLVMFTLRAAIDERHWPVIGHDPAPIPPKANMYRMAGGVFQDEVLLREETSADKKRLPLQAIGGNIAGERRIRAVLGMPQPPLESALPTKVQKQPVAAPARPRATDENRFWSMIEEAWTSAAPSAATKRPGLATKVSAKAAAALSKALDSVVAALEQLLGNLSRKELIAFDRVLERSLYTIDRADVQRHTDGSDDGFLYARGFIVAMGRRYFDLVCADPSKAIADMEEESITYLPHRVFEKRFDEEFPRSKISRETGSNLAGWRRAP